MSLCLFSRLNLKAGCAGQLPSMNRDESGKKQLLCDLVVVLFLQTMKGCDKNPYYRF